MRGELLTLALAATLGAAGGVTASVMVINQRLPQSEAVVAKASPRARFAVLRLSDWLPDKTSPATIDRAMRERRAAVDKLVGEGYVVLNADAIFGAPPATLVRPPAKEDGAGQ